MIQADATKTNMHKIMNYDKVCAELATLRAENERFRYYLRAIAESDDNRFIWPREMAKEALK